MLFPSEYETLADVQALDFVPVEQCHNAVVNDGIGTLERVWIVYLTHVLIPCLPFANTKKRFSELLLAAPGNPHKAI